MFKNLLNKLSINKTNNIEPKSFQSWTNIKEVNDGNIILSNNKKIKILKILPINFNLKSELEQKAILNSYKLFLKNLNSEIQIIVSSKKTDVSAHLDKILKITKENSKILEMSKDYIDLINSIIDEKGTITKEFFIILPYSNNIDNDVLKITESLMLCGNYVEICTKNEIISLLKNFLNKRIINNSNYS